MRGQLVLVAVITAGCYGDQIEPSLDAQPADDPREIVTLQFLADAVDLAGFPVYFQNADSSLVLATHTDSDGRARAFMRPGGFVTLALPSGRVYTYGSVRGGDTLVVNEADNDTSSKQIQVALPPSPGANVYTMWTSCGASRLEADPITQGMPQQVQLIGCGDTSDVVVTASWVEQGFSTNYRYLYAKDVALDPSAIAMLGGEFVPQSDSEVSATEVLDAAPRVVFTQQLVRDRKELAPSRSITADVVGGIASGRITKVITPPDGTMLTRVSPQALGVSAQTTLEWGPSGTQTQIAPGDHALRSYTTRPELLANASSVTWTEEPAGEVGRLVMLELSWSPDDARSQVWKILAPRDEATIVRYPVLPVPELRAPADAWVTQLATLSVSEDSSLRTTLLGAWPGNDAWLADTEAGRADYRVLVPPLRN